MIRPPGFRGAAFTNAQDGDPFGDVDARAGISAALQVTDEWATVSQVHGNVVKQALTAGDAGDADAVFTTVASLPVAVKTADCVPVVIESPGAVAAVHAGWRGMAAGVLRAATETMSGLGERPTRAAIGPAIGPCCYEVGEEVVNAVGFEGRTSWGTRSVDLVGAATEQLAGLDVWAAGECTRCGTGYHSFRRDQTDSRQAGIGWIP